MVSKDLVNELKRVLAKVISKTQNAFVEGRQILDAVLVANKAIDSILRNNPRAIPCKLDIGKAHDHVDWSLLSWVMGKMDFEERWIRWCFSTASFCVDQYSYWVF